MSDKDLPAAPAEASVSPPAGRSRREGNESLWKRARRTLGTNSLTFLQPQSRPPGASTSAPGSGPAPPNKRREQVRHAQRTHRQRTQNYIKTLESEVIRLRESETNLISERERLRAHIELLKSTIVSANLPLPLGSDAQDPALAQSQPLIDFSMPATVSYSTDDLAHERLHVQWPTRPSTMDTPSNFKQDPRLVQGYEPSQDFGTMPDLSQDFTLNPLSISSDTPPPFLLSSGSTPFVQPLDPKYAAKVDTLETAIDFVLALEYPCMDHIPHPANPPSADPANHVMMMSAPLVARAPGSPKLNTTWETSGVIIKELLNLSSSINLEGEITPVEAWHRLHQHPDFWKLDKAAIEKLKGELSGAVHCCGFGAVLDEQVFWQSFHGVIAASTTRRGR